MTVERLGSRRFDPEDQHRFARLSGDFNPIHLDSVFARRTQAGLPVVHGVHLLLWLLERVATARPELRQVGRLKARFSRMIFPGDTVEARITSSSNESLLAHILSDGAQSVELGLTLGAPAAAIDVPSKADIPRIMAPARAQDLSLAEMEGRAGRLGFAATPAEMAREYPHAAALVGGHRLAALACSSLLVGMILPGLHSLYGSLSVDFCDDGNPADELVFRTSAVLARYSRIRLRVEGGGLAGEIEAFVRKPPTPQIDVALLAPLVPSGAFAGAQVLVVGGSRGLGELTAKLLAAGGAHVTITYAVGEAEAEGVASRIRDWGGTCEILRLDVRSRVEEQLRALPCAPTHLYYFATPPIFRQRSHAFSQTLFDDFNAVYVTGFYAVLDACLKLCPDGLRVFYPSSTAVEERPSNLTEYAMSKAAAEVLCDSLKGSKMRLFVERLPRLPTDQTATLLKIATADPIRTLLPIVMAIQACDPSGSGVL